MIDEGINLSWMRSALFEIFVKAFDGYVRLSRL